MTSLRDELGKDLPQLSAPKLGLVKSRLAAQSEQLSQFYGGVAIDHRPRPDDYEEVKAALQRGSEGVTALPRRLLSCLPFVALYDNNRTWQADQSIIDAYLRRLDGDTYRGLFSNLWTHYLLTFEHDDAATNAVARFLDGHFDTLPDLLAGFTRKYVFLNPLIGPLRMAEAALAGNELLEDFSSIGITPERLRTSALIVAILGSVGRVLKTDSVRGDPVSRVRILLANHVTDVIQRAPARLELRKRAVKSFVEGLVVWQQMPERVNTNPEPTLSLLLEINRDPRFVPARWRGIVDEPAISTIEAWLGRKTIEAFFRVVNDLHVDRGDMWEERKKFWLSYLPFVKKAWLIVGSGAIPHARREGVQFGKFGGGAARDHCGLLMLIDDLMVLEMNKVGRAVLWKDGAVSGGVFPEVYDENTPYDLRNITMYVSKREEWQGSSIASHINRRMGGNENFPIKFNKILADTFGLGDSSEDAVLYPSARDPSRRLQFSSRAETQSVYGEPWPGAVRCMAR
jgi:hypothetical protein